MRSIDALLAGSFILCACLVSGCQQPGDAEAAYKPAAVAEESIPSASRQPAPTAAATPAAVETYASPAAARQVVIDYYAAINARAYPLAYSKWSDDGAASGQSLEQFTRGYANTTAVQARASGPENEQGAAGSRYIEVPVELTSIQRDGSQRRYRGHFILRAVVADGASQQQRRWHLASAELQRLPQ